MLAALGQERVAPEELPAEGEAAAGDAAAKDAGTGAGGAGAGAADTKKPKKSPSVAGASAAKFAYMLVYRRKDAGRADPIPADVRRGAIAASPMPRPPPHRARVWYVCVCAGCAEGAAR